MAQPGTKFTRKLRNAALATFICGAAAAATGCAEVTKVGNDHYTLAFWHEVSDTIVWDWKSPTCNQDADGDGNVGTPKDRAYCAFFITRASFCNHIPSGTGELICKAATNPNGTDTSGRPLWFDFTAAGQGYLNGGGYCLGVTFGAFGDIRSWVRLDRGQEGCKSVGSLPPTT